MSVQEYSLTVSRRLLRWSALSMSAGLLLATSSEPVERGMGEQFMAWGAVDGALALAGMWMGRRRQAIPGDPERQMKDARNLQRLLLVNAGLDVFYVLGGAGLALGRGRSDETWRGRGLGVMIQGGFLLAFDLWHGLRFPTSTPLK